jgi:hypothetical protein
MGVLLDLLSGQLLSPLPYLVLSFAYSMYIEISILSVGRGDDNFMDLG